MSINAILKTELPGIKEFLRGNFILGVIPGILNVQLDKDWSSFEKTVHHRELERFLHDPKDGYLT